MDRLKMLKRIIAAAAIALAAVSGSSSDMVRLPASAQDTSSAEDPSSSAEDASPEDEGTEEEKKAREEYNKKLSKISKKQKKVAEELEQLEDTEENEQQKQMLILEKISLINEKSGVVNSYLTQMEMQLAAERQSNLELSEDIEEGIAMYKKRLRALYLAGDMSYGDVLLGAGDFYDMLMRSELLRRVTEYDAKTIDALVEKKGIYDGQLRSMQRKQGEYDEQALALERERAELAVLYDNNAEAKKLLLAEQAAAAERERKFEYEVSNYSSGAMNEILLGSYSGPEDDAFRIETEKEANAKLDELHAAINVRKAAKQTIPDDECLYNFKWPVKNHTEISSGVGPRWGLYHKGLDIPGEGGFPISAAEAGTVIMTNNTCTHNYGKDYSCGCGGGYGNFVIIDHGNGFLTLYGHMTKTEVSEGDKVKCGQEIGLMGSTGWSTGSHLHFELRFGGYVTNPANFVTY